MGKVFNFLNGLIGYFNLQILITRLLVLRGKKILNGVMVDNISRNKTIKTLILMLFVDDVLGQKKVNEAGLTSVVIEKKRNFVSLLIGNLGIKVGNGLYG